MEKIYLAGPMFNKAEKDFNLIITAMFENAGYSVFLPQRDGFESSLMEGKSGAEKTKLIFDEDTNAIKNSDIIFMVLDGRVPDDGACVELGIAYTLGKKCYGIKTDVRCIEKDLDLNPLIAGCFSKIFYDNKNQTALEQLSDFIKNEKF